MGRVNKLRYNRRFRGLALALFLVVLMACTWVYAPMIERLIENPEAFRKLILSYGSSSALIYVAFMALQIVIAIIPGEVVQIAGGYLFGTLWGTVLAVVGAILGTFVTFYAARILGYGYLRLVVHPRKLKKLTQLINSPKAKAVMFLLFLIPGIPKDLLVYVAGITPIKPSVFITLSILARIPAIVGAALIGAHMQRGDYVFVMIITGISVILFCLGYYYKDRIVNRLHAFSHKHHFPHKKDQL